MHCGRTINFTLFLRILVTFPPKTARSFKMSGNVNKESPKNVFTQRFNPVTGKNEWDMQDENYDYHQEIARSAYADMLHDTERNKKYFAGLKWAINEMRARGKVVRVLDIGTGTGLLSLMAAQLGADEVTACEAFAPMAACAKRVINQNGFCSKIRLITKRSTEIAVGPGCDMPHRANILVTEVFDTELIGEGAISTFNHAHEHLLEKNCLTVPSRATVYVQIVESSLLWSWNQPRPPSLEQFKLLLPEEIQQCHGSNAVLDLQMSQLPIDSFRPLSDPIPVLTFDFTGAKRIAEIEQYQVEVTAKDSGRCEAIFFWWDIEMDCKGDIKLSCAPWWNHSLAKAQPWRDHWMQAVYYPSQPLVVKGGENAILHCFHDEYSFWFDIQEDANRLSTKTANRTVRPTCTCGFHKICNPCRIGMVSDSATTEKYFNILKNLIKPNTICAFIGNGGSFLPLMAAKLGAKKVYVIDSEHFSVKLLNTFIRRNDLECKIKVLEKTVENLNADDFDQRKVDVFFSEPYFLSSLLPWHSLQYWYALAQLSHHKSSLSRTIPKLGKLWAMGMHFLHLWKIKAPLHEVEGFKMELFDHIIQNSSSIADHPVEPHSLWEYEGLALTNPFLIYSFDMNETLPEEILTAADSISLQSGPQHCNGVALWMEWILDEETSINRGPIVQPTLGQRVQWNPTSKQGVYFLHSATNTITCKHLSYQVSFSGKVGSFEFKFSVT